MNADSIVVTQDALKHAFHPTGDTCPAEAEALLKQLAEWDTASALHTRRVGRACRQFGTFLNLPVEQLRTLKMAAYLHDIGKLDTPKQILSKPGRLNDEEYRCIQQHASSGAKRLEDAGFATEIVDITRHHHEWWNGRGYPEGLSGTAFPLESRIIAIVDAWDAITARRSYHRQRTEFLALSEIRNNAGTQFDPTLAPAFIEFSVRRLADRRCA